MEEDLIISKKIINRINLILGFILAFIPVFTSLFALIGIELKTLIPLLIFSIAYLFFLVFISLNFFGSKEYKDRFIQFFKSPIGVVATIMIAWVLLSSIITKVFNLQLIYYLSFVLMFICFYILDKKSFKILINTMFIVIGISCLLGIINPRNDIIPGFIPQALPFSTHFINPNHSSYVATILAVLVFNYFHKSKKIRYNIYYMVLYLVYTFFLFLNGTYASIFALLIVEVFEIIYMWIKLKKCPIKMIALLFTFIALCFLSDIYPNISSIRTCKYNFFLESIAVFDNIFNTNILSIFNIQEIAGADGWDRDVLVLDTFSFLTSSFKVFMFGAGAGCTYTYAPHNVFLGLWLDFGIVVPICLVAIIILLFIKICKNQFNFNNFLSASSLIVSFILLHFGNIFPCSFIYFILTIAMTARYDLNKKENLSEE